MTRHVPQAQDAHAAGLAAVARKTLEVGGIPQEPEKAVSEWLANNDWATHLETSWVPYEETWYPLAQGVLDLASRLEELEQELDEREKVLAELEQAAWAVIEKLNPQVPWMDEALELQHKLVATGRARRADERKEN